MGFSFWDYVVILGVAPRGGEGTGAALAAPLCKNWGNGVRSPPEAVFRDGGGSQFSALGLGTGLFRKPSEKSRMETVAQACGP